MALLLETQRQLSILKYDTPGKLARVIEPKREQTPALDILDQALIDAFEGRQSWLIFTMPPQEGKSERVSRTFPVWALTRNPDLRIAIVSYADDLAMRWGRQTRDDIKANSDELGLRIAPDIAASKEWRIAGRNGGVVTTGISGGLTGRPVDILIIDDPLKDQKEADSATIRKTCQDFWRSTASTRLPEASVVIIVMTRWHEDDLAGWLLATQPEDFRLINIPAQAEHRDGDPECKCAVHPKATCMGGDILGRRHGDYMRSARRRSKAGWEKRKRSMGSRAWAALCQGRPAPEDGNIFKSHWWRIHQVPRAVQLSDGTWYVPGADQVIISLDASFKDTSKSDYVAISVWARRGRLLDLVDIVCDRWEFTQTCVELEMMVAKWPQATKRLIEDKANGPAIISALRLKIGGLVPFDPKDSKEARARAVAPFVEAGDVGVPRFEDLPKVVEFISQCTAFPNGANDDMVDSFTQAAIDLLQIGSQDLMEELLAEQGHAHEVEHGDKPWTPQDGPQDPDENPGGLWG